MPTLADIYSAADSFKRRLADAASNPSGSLQQMLGYANDRARNFNELQQQSLAETRQGGFANQGPATQALNQAYMESSMVPAITVWHGSPHIFERFDSSKIGTGEGAQMYGKGLYTAQQQEVAKRFTPRDMNFEDSLMKKYNQAEKAGDYASMQVYEDFLAQKTPEEIASSLGEMGFSGKDAISANKAFDTAKKMYQGQTKGSLYKVDLPDTHIRRMLDWDAPLKDQPYNVRSFAKKMGMDMTDLGGDLVAKVGKSEEGKRMMQEAGIPGIKYLDQASQNAAGWHITPPNQTVSGKWMVKGSDYNSKGSHFDTEQEAKDFMKQKLGEATRNFVVFDPNHLTILERNSKPIK